MKRLGASGLAVVCLAVAGALAAVTDSELAARFHYDLGPAQVDVSGYPESVKNGYERFLAACSRCHTPARALNSPMTKREDWQRFIRRMHVKAGSKKGAALAKTEGAAILEFLTYDSKVRKLDGRAAFEAQDRELQGRFVRVQAELTRRLREDAESKAQQPAPYTGAKP